MIDKNHRCVCWVMCLRWHVKGFWDKICSLVIVVLCKGVRCRINRHYRANSPDANGSIKPGPKYIAFHPKRKPDKSGKHFIISFHFQLTTLLLPIDEQNCSAICLAMAMIFLWLPVRLRRPQILVFTKTKAITTESIPAGVAAIRQLEKTTTLALIQPMMQVHSTTTI